MASRWLERHAPWLLGALGLALIAVFALIGALFVRLEETRDDLDRVEGGALLATVQLQAFRDELTALGPAVSGGLDDAIASLETFGDASLAFEVRVDDDVAIDTEIAIDREFIVPIDTTIPINQTIETTVDARGPLGIVVPIDVVVPINLDVPIVLDLAFTIQETVPLSTTIPVRLTLPIEIDVADTGLAELGDALSAGLISFREAFAALAE